MISHNGLRYVRIHDEQIFKTKSLEDSVYFTLRDMFLNMSSSCNYIMDTTYFCAQLTNYISFQKRIEPFTYTNVLNDKKFLKSFLQWLSFIKPSDFQEDHTEEFEGYDIDEFMLFDLWWEQVNILKSILTEKLKTLENTTHFYSNSS
jgi:hypothetical protein